jgi:hypothetical protein
MRDVDASWPQVGAQLHHRVGPWPVNVNDKTTVRAMIPDRLLELDARIWPLGTARIRITLEPDGEHTRVRMAEWLTSPLASLLPSAAQSALLVPRNREALARLDDLAVHRVARR